MKIIISEQQYNLIKDSNQYKEIKEKVDYKVAEPYLKTDRNEITTERINQIFSALKSEPNFINQSKNGDRLYFDLIKTSENNPTYDSIKDILQGTDYELNNVEEYKKGYLTDKKYNRKVKIPATLQLIGKKSGKDLSNIINQYNTDPIRTGTKTKSDYLIVISKHKYDLAGMTTGREWEGKSCMKLVTGLYSKKVFCDIKEGTIVAYVINLNDVTVKNPLNLENPSGRLLIKPYISEENEKDVYYHAGKVYGDNVNDFKGVIEKMLDNIQKELFGIYLFHEDLYNDYDPKVITKLNNDNIVDVGDFGEYGGNIALAKLKDGSNMFINRSGDASIKGVDVDKLIYNNIRTLYFNQLLGSNKYKHVFEFNSDGIAWVMLNDDSDIFIDKTGNLSVKGLNPKTMPDWQRPAYYRSLLDNNNIVRVGNFGIYGDNVAEAGLRNGVSIFINEMGEYSVEGIHINDLISPIARAAYFNSLLKTNDFTYAFPQYYNNNVFKVELLDDTSIYMDQNGKPTVEGLLYKDDTYYNTLKLINQKQLQENINKIKSMINVI